MPVWDVSSIIQMRCSTTWRSSGASSRKSGISFSSASAYRMAPCTFLAPGYSPRSICRIFSPPFASV